MKHRSYSFLIALLLGLGLKAATYYVSPTGNDSNNGTSQTTAWQTIARVNQLGTSLQPGDRILFQRGGLYRGKLTINANGSAASCIEVGAYGSGDHPIISGSIPVTGWTQHNGNIWRANIAQRPKHIYSNGALQTIARFPNSGWLRVDQGTSTSLTDAELTQPNGYWNGSTAVIRTTNWSYDTAYVTAHGNGILTHSATGNNLASYNWGYFMQNKLELLDAPGEWFYDSAAGHLYFWCPGNINPNNALVEGTVLDNGIYVSYQRHHIRIDGLHLRHHTSASLRLSGSTQLEAMNCLINDTWQAILSTGSQQSFHHLNIQRTYATAVFLQDNGTTFANNIIHNVCREPGLGENNWGYIGLRTNGYDMIIRDNVFTEVGYCAINTERNALVERNIVRDCMKLLNDGGGIAFDNADGMIIRNNIVQDLVGNFESSAPNFHACYSISFGIYFGNISNKNTLVKNNTVSNCSSGIYIDHTMASTGNRIEDNVLFNNAIGLFLSDFSNNNGPAATPPYHVPQFNDVYSGNVIYAVKKEQLCMKQYHVYNANLVDYGTFTNNRYFNPYNDRSIFLHNVFNGTEKYYTLERWQSERNEDQGSTRSPLRLADMDVTEVFGGNLVPNGAFAGNVSDWGGWPTSGTVTHNTAQLDNGSLRANYTANNGSPWFYLKHNTNVAVQQGQWYRMRFSLISDMVGEVKVGFKGLSQATGPQMEGARFIPFDGNRRDMEIFFQSSITDQGYCSFTNHYTEGRYFLDNVELHRVAATPVNPFLQQQLLVNDQAVAQDMPLTGCWSDVHGGLHHGSVTLQPWSSIVLVKEEDATCLSTDVPNLDEEMAAIGFMVMPNPIVRGMALSIGNTRITSGQLRLFDLSGQLVWSDRFHGDAVAHEMPPSLGAGMYLLQVEGNGRMAQERVMLL
ncbi:MAG: T9SS type A sorting domain-containing protein [Flavobacteriales bacterium]|nr:T9SS type A sorting domain-containing protein [Flavobacteriales bacterium]